MLLESLNKRVLWEGDDGVLFRTILCMNFSPLFVFEIKYTTLRFMDRIGHSPEVKV
jgi:hypothetical protein